MFKQQEHNEVFKEVETIIGASLKVKGNFQGQGNIVVEGILDGTLKTSGHVFVGNKAKIVGNIEAIDVKIGGEINGNIKSSGFLQISATSKISGDIECKLLSIEKGAIINGKCAMLPISNQDKKIV